MGVDLLLEVVYQAAVGDEQQGVLGVGELVLAVLLPEKQVVPGGGEELHAHGVGLGALHGGAAQGVGLYLLVGYIVGEGVARLVGEHVHVPEVPLKLEKMKG